MQKHILNLVLCVTPLALLAQAPSLVVEPDFSNSFFFLQPDSSLKPLQRESMALNSKIKFMGYGGAEATYQIQGEHSPLRIASASTPFIIVKLDGSSDPANIVSIYPLQVGKGQRSLAFLKTHFLGTGMKNKMQGKDIPFTYERYGQGSVKITMSSPLAAGEYGIVLASGMNQPQPFAYCFGVDTAVQ